MDGGSIDIDGSTMASDAAWVR